MKWLYSVPPFLTLCCFLCLAVLTMCRGAKTKTNRLFLLICLLADVGLMRAVTGSLSGLGLPLRLAFTMLFIAPLGFFMGMPFPKAVRRVGELVDWGFAVNGTASVIGSTVVMLVVMTTGLNSGLILAGLLYGAAFLLSRIERAE